MTRDTCIAGVLAALRLASQAPGTAHALIHAERHALGRAFLTAVQSEAGAFLGPLRLEIDFDPLYRMSRWFEQGLARAHRDLLVQRLRDTTIEITLRADQAQRMLAITGQRDAFLGLARAMLETLALASTS